MSWPKHSPEWSKGRSHEHNRPYWDGHMFIVAYLCARGYSLRKVGNVIGLSPERVRQMRDRAARIAKYGERWRVPDV